jgi:nucleotide-binding universal stress UspA family protein
MTTAPAPADTARTQRVVVGVDGSPGAARALTWALAEAEQRHADLDVVIAWDVPYQWAEGFNAKWGEDADYFAGAAATLAEAELTGVLQGAPRPEWVHVQPMEGGAAHVLLQRARDADLLVVGSRGRGGFADLLLGSVSTACVHHAPCPVAVIPLR